jgi:hypothetical protein
MATFTHQVFDVTSQTPPSLIDSLSGTNNEVVLYTTGVSVSGKTVVGVLYNSIGASSANITLSSYGLIIGVNTAYHGSQMALYYSDNSTTLFTVNSGLTGTSFYSVISAGTITFDNRGPRQRRRFAVEF